LRYEFGRGNTEHIRDLEQYNDIWTLDAPLHQADERSIQASGFRELLLRDARALAALPEG
jgi:hypothetical protein